MSILVTPSLLCDSCGIDQDTYHTGHPELLKIGMARENGKKWGWVSRKDYGQGKMRDACPECAKKLGLKP